MSAARKRGRPETPTADYGPRVRLDNGTIVIGYRADPDMPNAPDIRAASALILYDFLHRHGFLTDEQREAADRYLIRCEQASGAVERQGERVRGGGGGQGTPTERQVSALADLRQADSVLGVDTAMVREIVAWNRAPEGGIETARFAVAMEKLADLWGM